MPAPLGLGLAAGVVALVLGVLWLASGAVGPVVSGVAGGLGGFIATVGSAVGSAPPTQPPPTSGAPTIVAPESAYTNDDTVDVTVNVPPDVVGDASYTLRLYVEVGDQPPDLLVEQPVGQTSVQLIAGVGLQKGRNTFQAAISGPGGESERSPVVTWIRDNSKPKLAIISPKDGSSTNKASATIKGKTQAGSTVRLKNDENGASATVQANKDGLFEARIALAQGLNSIRLTTTDPAGNANDGSITIRRGAGKPTAQLTATSYQFRARNLPRTVTFTVEVTDPDGAPVADATALFTISVPGLEAIVSSELRTNENGTARFTTTIPKGADKGSGLAAVLVDADEYGKLTARQVLTVR